MPESAVNPGSAVAEIETGQAQSTDPVAFEPGAFGDWNEKLPSDYTECLKRLATEFCDEFRYPRRLQVMMDWKARSFWREMQHLNWNFEQECWDILGPLGSKVSAGSEQTFDSAILYSTNMYQGFGDAYIAIITQAIPALRFEPEDPEDPSDIETAKHGDAMRRLVQHENDPMKLMTEAAYFSWVCGLMSGWTRWEVDKRTGQGRETQTMYGALEVKVPLIYACQEDYPYLQFSKEYHLTTIREKVKKRAFNDQDYWKKIKGGAHGNGQDVYERTARISVQQGISMRSAGGDAYGNLVTTQRTWMRPSVFLSDKVDEQYRDNLIALFPNGCYTEFDNGVYTGSRDASMDDEWVVENVMSGDGSFRNGKGTCLISVQERFNDLINITQDVYEKTIPASHWDNKIFNVPAMNKQKADPGAKYPFNADNLPVGDQVANHVFFEKESEIDPEMLMYSKLLMTDIPEFLTGISQILFGADTSKDKSGKALSIQQNAAMGRIGLPFRVMKRLYARMMEQAIRCSSRNRSTDWVAGIPDEQGRVETVAVRLEDMFGSVRCYPDSDEHYPTSWNDKRSIYLQLMMEGNTDPVLKMILTNPQNQNLAKRLLGLQELTLPDAESWNKQEAEIAYLLLEPPNIVQPPPMQMPNPLMPHIMESIPQAPQPQTTIPIDPDYDNHQAEFLTVTIWINGEKGQKAKKTNPAGFMNVRLHGLAHKQEIMKAMAAAAPPPPPPAAPPGGGKEPPKPEQKAPAAQAA